MSKDTINVGGEEKVVREDTAKSYRGTIWALVSVAAFVIIVAALLFAFFGRSMFNTDMQNPQKIDEKRRTGQ